MKQYLDLLQYVLDNGEFKGDPQGVGNRAILGYQMRFNMADGFPLLTTKKLHLKAISYELLWFIKGSSDNNWLNEHGVSIWNEWATPEMTARYGRKPGDLGPIYGPM